MRQALNYTILLLRKHKIEDRQLAPPETCLTVRHISKALSLNYREAELFSLRNIDYLQALGSGVVHGIHCAAGLLCEVANTKAAAIDQVAVSLMYTMRWVMLMIGS